MSVKEAIRKGKQKEGAAAASVISSNVAAAYSNASLKEDPFCLHWTFPFQQIFCLFFQSSIICPGNWENRNATLEKSVLESLLPESPGIAASKAK